MKSFFVLLSMLALACETPATAYDKDDSKTEQHVPDAGEESGGAQKNSIMEKLEDVQFEPADKYGEQEGEFQPNFPAVYWDFDEFVDLLYGDVVIINFDALPSGPAVAPGFDQVTRQVTGALLTGEEWRDLGAVFSSPAGAALRTVSRIDFCCPDGTPTVGLFVSRPNSLTMGAAPYTPPLDPADNENVVDENDDSLIIDLVNPKAAVGFYLIDQDGTDANESIIFRDVNGNVIKTIQPLPTANNGDDISIDHVVLSN